MTAITVTYNAKLQRMVKAMKADIDRQLVPILKAYAPEYVQDAAPTLDGWADAIAVALAALRARWVDSPAAKAFAQMIAGEVVRTSLTKSVRDLQKSAGIDVYTGNVNLQEYTKAAAQQNASLITSISSQYLDNVGNIVLTNTRAGLRPGSIVSLLVDQYGVTQRRAKFIARDQSAKLAGDFAEFQQKGAGFQYFKWIDSGDSRVRHRHEEIANKLTAYGEGIYRWDNLPSSDKGDPIKPGQDYNCRCTSRPVSEREVKRNQERGLVAVGVYK